VKRFAILFEFLSVAMLIVGFGCVRLLDGVDFYHHLFEFR
jgi:hypothetical protein